MLPRDLYWRDHNVLRGEGCPLAHGSGEDSCRPVSLHPRGLEYRLLPVVQLKPDFGIPYVLCWRVPSAIHRIQLPFQHHRQHYHHHHHHHHHHYHRQYHRQRRRRHFRSSSPRGHLAAVAPFSVSSARFPSPYSCTLRRGDLPALPGMETR